ncbi:MAG TPA: hypothetical protein VNU70_07785 [Puia sp.]|jgi:hypothetical protein|nr:hypothetical protein [Puia sp.]
MRKKNFRIVVFSLLGAGLITMILSLLVEDENRKKVLLMITGGFYLAAAVQIVVYRMKPKAFDDKQKNNG